MPDVIDRRVAAAIDDLAGRGLRPPEIHRRLATSEKVKQIGVRVPDLRTVQRRVRAVMPSPPWRLEQATPGEIAPVLGVLREMLAAGRTRGGGTLITQREAALVVRVHAATGGRLGEWLTWRIARLYAARGDGDCSDLDAFLAFYGAEAFTAPGGVTGTYDVVRARLWSDRPRPDVAALEEWATILELDEGEGH